MSTHPLPFTDIPFPTPLPWPPRKYCRDCAAFIIAVCGRGLLRGVAGKFKDDAATGSGRFCREEWWDGNVKAIRREDGNRDAVVEEEIEQ